MLVVVKHRDLHPLLEPRFDLKTLRTLDVFEIDAAEGRLQRGHRLDHALDGVGGDLDVEHVDAREFLEQNRLALHHRLRCQRTDIAKTENGSAVGDDRDKVGAGCQRCGFRRVFGDLHARRRHARRISEREVALVGKRLDGLNLKLARSRQPMVGQCRGMEIFRIGRHTCSRVSDLEPLFLW